MTSRKPAIYLGISGGIIALIVVGLLAIKALAAPKRLDGAGNVVVLELHGNGAPDSYNNFFARPTAFEIASKCPDRMVDNVIPLKTNRDANDYRYLIILCKFSAAARRNTE